MTWITHPTILTGDIVELRPLDWEHFDELAALARDTRIWEHYIYDGADPIRLKEVMQDALAQREKGTQYPFVIYHRQTGKLAGSTRLLELNQKHRKLEIGSTWLHPDHWASAVNLECKLLLLTYCFEELKTVRVQLKTNEKNVRSRRAIEKIGGKYEGILRHDLIGDSGISRNSAYYSIIDSEWTDAKSHLAKLLSEKKKN